MTSIRDAARQANQAGLVPIPIRPDGTKAPAPQTWAEYQTRRPSNSELRKWFTDTTAGVGIICGAISGGLELLEFEAEAGGFDTIATIVPELPAIASRTAPQLLATASDVYEWVSAIWRPIEKGVS